MNRENQNHAGWHLDPDSGVWMRAVIHSMARRCRNWDYCGTGTYLITLVLNDRSRPVLGRLDESKPTIVLSELGRAVEAHFRRIPEFTPEIEVLGVQVMPEHLHGVVRVAALGCVCTQSHRAADRRQWRG